MDTKNLSFFHKRKTTTLTARILIRQASKSSLRADVSYFLSYFLRADVSFFMQAIESLKYDKIKHRKLVKEKLQNRVSIPT